MSDLAKAAVALARRGGWSEEADMTDALVDLGISFTAQQRNAVAETFAALYRAGCEDGRTRENHEQPAPDRKPDPIAVGCEVLRVRRFPGGKPMLLARTTIKRPTSTQWITSDGYRFGNDSRRACLGYKNEFLMTEAEYLEAGGVL